MSNGNDGGLVITTLMCLGFMFLIIAGSTGFLGVIVEAINEVKGIVLILLIPCIIGFVYGWFAFGISLFVAVVIIINGGGGKSRGSGTGNSGYHPHHGGGGAGPGGSSNG